MKNIRMTLDPESVAEALRQIEDFEKKLKPAMQCLIDYLGEKGVEIARAELLWVGGSDGGGGEPVENPAFRTGALSGSIRYRKPEDGRGEITAGEGLYTEYGSYAMFVEYGTGYVGEQNEEPHAKEEGYAYDVGQYGARGWWYPAPWGTMKAYDGTMLAWTAGMAPRPFMHNTALDLEEEAKEMGAKVIAEYIRGERA